jgi:predicted TIM-barrel fold metal-dependent hydrolase
MINYPIQPKPKIQNPKFIRGVCMKADFESYYTLEYQNKPFTIEQIFEMEDEAGIDIAVVMPNTAEVPDNERLAKAIKGNKRALGCALIDPKSGKKGIDELKKAVTDWGFKGLKLMAVIHKYNVDDEIVNPLVKTARELGIPVSIHSGPDNCHPNRIVNVAKRFPDVPIIMDHMGYPDHWREGIQAAKENDNIYLGTTILRFHKRWGNDPNTVVPTEVKEAVNKVGAERVVFGSNLPEYRPIQVMKAIQRLELGEETEKLIFGENLARIYGMKV